MQEQPFSRIVLQQEQGSRVSGQESDEEMMRVAMGCVLIVKGEFNERGTTQDARAVK